MNDLQIRKAFHGSFLLEHHAEPTTLVFDELGLQHGKCRADIAVINGNLMGFEIKSDVDSLRRLGSQVDAYNAVFDRASIVVTNRHLGQAEDLLPQWWGLVCIVNDGLGQPKFTSIRLPAENPAVDEYSVAQLLWRNEAQEALLRLGVTGKRLRESRSRLYRYLVEMVDPGALRLIVKERLKKRRGWPHLVPPFPDGDSSPPTAML